MPFFVAVLILLEVGGTKHITVRRLGVLRRLWSVFRHYVFITLLQTAEMVVEGISFGPGRRLHAPLLARVAMHLMGHLLSLSVMSWLCVRHSPH